MLVLVFYYCRNPQFSPIFARIAESYFNSPGVSVPLLRLFDELVWNKFGRLQFESFSANGILVFKEAAKVVVTHGKNHLLVFLIVHRFAAFAGLTSSRPIRGEIQMYKLNFRNFISCPVW